MKKTKMLALLLVISMGISGCGGKSDSGERQQALKEQGMELQMAGNYREAIEKYEKALSLADMEAGAEEIDLAYYKASAQYQSGDLTAAIDTYSAILALERSEESYLGRGMLYLAAGETEKAQADLQKALEQTKDLLVKGIIYSVTDETVKAKECFEKAYEDGDSRGLFYLANIYEKAGDEEYAMILLEKYINSGTAGAEGYLSVAKKYFDTGAYEDALEQVQAGIALGDSGVMKNLLQEEIACYEKLGNFAGAKEKAENYLELYPDDTMIQREYEFLKSR